MSAGTGVLIRDLTRTVAVHRRVLAAVCAAGAVAAALAVLAPAPPPSTRVLAAARELTAGRTLTIDDVRTVELPQSAVPAGVLRPGAAVLGRMVATPVRRGEPLTDVRLLGAELLGSLPADGLVAAPVRIADPAAVGLLRAGDRVDVLAAVEGAREAAVVAAGVLVVTVPAAGESDPFDGGALVVLAATPATARRLAAAAVAARLSVVVRG